MTNKETVQALVDALRIAEQKLLEFEQYASGGDDEINVEPAILMTRAALLAGQQLLAQKEDEPDLTTAYMCGYAKGKDDALARVQKPLTDEQIMEMVLAECDNMRWPSTAIYIARAIERAHGIEEQK